MRPWIHLDALAPGQKAKPAMTCARHPRPGKGLNLAELFDQSGIVVKELLHGCLGGGIAAFNHNAAIRLGLQGKFCIAAHSKAAHAAVQRLTEFGIIQHGRMAALLALSVLLAAVSLPLLSTVMDTRSTGTDASSGKGRTQILADGRVALKPGLHIGLIRGIGAGSREGAVSS